MQVHNHACMFNTSMLNYTNALPALIIHTYIKHQDTLLKEEEMIQAIVEAVKEQCRCEFPQIILLVVHFCASKNLPAEL